MPRRLSKKQRAVMLDIIAQVNGDEITSMREFNDYLSDNSLPQWFATWPLWSAGENMPGYMPESPYSLFLTERAARGYCRELERDGGGKEYVSDYMPVSFKEVLAP